MQLIVRGEQAYWGTARLRCVIGKNGLTANKLEGDGLTPTGVFPFREVFYRRDRVVGLTTILKKTPICPDMGWCDSPEHPDYNTLVTLPFSASHEVLYRDDHVYDVILVVGYNDNPVVPGKGSAVFIHLAQHDFAGTAGCVAFQRDDLLTILSECTAHSAVIIQQP